MVWVWSAVIVLAGMYVIPLGLSYFYLWRDERLAQGPSSRVPMRLHVPHGV